MILKIYQTIFYQPISTFFYFLYNLLHDLGLSILVFALCVRALLFPINRINIKTQAKLKRLQERVKEVEKKYANNKKQKMQAITDILQKEKVNPFPLFFLFLLQIPIVLVVFHLLKTQTSLAHKKFLWFFDLSKPIPIFAFVTASLPLFVSIYTKRQINFFSLISSLFVFFGLAFLPGALSLYFLFNVIILYLEEIFAKKWTK